VTGSALPTLGARQLSQPRGRPPADHPVLGSLATRSTPARCRPCGRRGRDCCRVWTTTRPLRG